MIIDQGEGGEGVAALSLDDVPPRCCNCDVYRWKQVEDRKLFFIAFLAIHTVQFANCYMPMEKRLKTWVLSCAAPTAT